MKIKCPACSKVLNIPDTAAGKVVKCPCGKQLRAPGGGAGSPPPPTPSTPPSAAGGAARPAGSPAAKRPAPARPGPAMGGFDAGMLDELTDQDLQPVASTSRSASAPAGGGNLAQQYAPPGGGSGGGSFRRGPLASPWIRLGASIVDGFVIGLMVLPVIAGCMFVLVPLFVDAEALQGMQDVPPEQQQAAMAQASGGFMLAYGISALLAYLPPIVLYAIMVTKTGQTPGKKLCGIRILKSDTGELPGFVHGVLLRSWIKNIAYSIPLIGAVVALIDVVMIFTEERQCLHDRIASTIVVES